MAILLNCKRIQAENDYLDYKINKYTSLIETISFDQDHRFLIEKYLKKMLGKKVMNLKLLKAMNK